MFKIRPQNRILVPLRGEKCSRYAHRTGSWYLLEVKDVQDTPNRTGSWYLLEVKDVQDTPNRTGSWYLLGVKNVQDTPTEQDLGTS